MSSPFQQVKEIWNRLPLTGRIATIGAAVATLALIAAVVYYGSQPEYGVLFADLKPADAQTIVEKLKAANVPYAISNNGTTVQVPADKISELRLQMASAGILSGGHVGFDLFDKTSFGATDFAQQVNYRRAIEGELAKTLEGMDEVEQARVHLTPKRESVYTEKEEGAKASVMLRVKQGKELSSERTDAIVSLIASAVEGLDPSGISVMDTRGRLLTAAGRNGGTFSDAGAFHAQLEAKQKFEAETAGRIISLLEPITGEGHVRADVSADVDFSKIEQTEEKYDPNSKVVRTQESTQETRNSNVKNPAAVVGARANDPTAAAPAPTPAPNPGAAAAPAVSAGDTRSSQSVTNEIDRTVKKTVGGTGRVNRMTVSVLVDHKTVEGVATARTPEEIKQIQELVQAAVGTDNARGDVVVVQTMLFDKPQLDAGTGGGASWLDRNKQLVASAVKYGTLIAIALLLLLFVVRPARRALLKAAAPPIEAKLLTAGSDEAEEAERRLTVKETQNALTQGENPLPELEPMMTVAELEAKMQNELENEVTTVNAHVHHAESIKKTITEQTLKDPEAVVSTLRGWLRESQG